MKKYTAFILVVCLLFCVVGCRIANKPQISHSEPYTVNTKISDVISDAAFGEYGRLIFPVNSGYYSENTLGELRLTWYSHIDPNKTVEIANYIKSRAEAGETIFYDIYSDEEKG